MTEKILEQYFGLKPENTIQDGRYKRYIIDHSLYSTIPVTNWEQEALIELYEMSEHMAKNGDPTVSTFIPGNHGKFLVTHEEQDYVVLHNYQIPAMRKGQTGRALAIFHERGKNMPNPITKLSHMGEWKNFWIRRLEQMEKVWASLLQEPGGEKFERLFIESFPYFMGLTENAIQYYTDTTMDEELTSFDFGTINHYRFTEHTWSSEFQIRNPFDWIFDHPARDLAEWIRHQYFQYPRSFRPELQRFIQSYESIAPLSRFAWRLVYSRLLFPLHYFTCVEDYFLSQTETSQRQLEEQLEKLVRETRDYELFLANFYHLASIDHEQLPLVEWLNK